MKNPSRWYHPKRLGALIVVEAFLAQAATSAHAGTVSQLPGVFINPPPVNVMFTLDDSLSMHSDVIPDIVAGAGIELGGLPPNTDNNSSAVAPEIASTLNRFGQPVGGSARQFPDMWGHLGHATAYLHAQYYSAAGASLQNVAGRFLRSSDGNPLYYNPKVRYRPWPTAADDKVLSANAIATAVNIHPSSPFVAGRSINLTAQINNGGLFWPATYFVKTSPAALTLAQPNSAAGATFTKVEIQPGVATYNKRHGAGEPDNRSDCAAATTCTYAEEMQNFANWLQYYRNRMLMAKGGVAAAFAKQGTNLRVGFGTINTPVSLGVREFNAVNRTDFYGQLYPVPRSTFGTPLRTALDSVGTYFQRSDANSPWAFEPAAGTLTPEYSCRRSFHILSTDGFWNGNDAPSPAGGTGNNNDNFSAQFTPVPQGKTVGFPYSNAADSKWGIRPFIDTSVNTLSDVAAYYWKTDLRADLDNNVSGSERDPAFWQHLSTFTVGLGVAGTGTVRKTADNSVADLSTAESRDQLVRDKTELTWPTPVANAATTGDDLIHAAMSSRGRYYSATNPTDLANGLSTALSEAADTAGDFAAVAGDSVQVRANGTVYQATFSPSRWYGRLYAFQQDASSGKVNNKPSDSTTPNSTQRWEASNKMPTAANRNIFTSDGTMNSGATFTWTGGLTGAQQTAVGSQDILNFLRGDASLEVANKVGSFRDRSRYTVAGVQGGVLGDIVNSSPIKGPDAGGGYDRLPASEATARASYASYRSSSALQNMRNTMYVGANDGMLHAFNLTSGVERFAYVPNAVYSVPRSKTGTEKKLQLLATDLTYTHRFTVDGPPNVGDAYLSNEWKSILVGSNGAGARGIYAIDVTNPDTVVAEGGKLFSKNKVMWEFSEASNPTHAADIGYILSYPHIARMRDGSWVAIFGNGYDSANGVAKLFIVKLDDGTVLKEIEVGPTTGGNGLSQPNFVLNSTREVIAIYAGDLKGNMWKFDVSDAAPANWKAAFAGGEPLFTASGGGGQVQPISVMPELSRHPEGGMMLTFGTGKLFEVEDTNTDATNDNLRTQSIYGIWDKPSETAGITATRATILQAQSTTLATGADFGSTSSTVTDFGTKRGWYLDLDTDSGERVNLTAQQVGKVIFVVANTPVADPCSGGGKSKVFGFDPVYGTAPDFAVFDLNSDGKFDASDSPAKNVRSISTSVMTQPLVQILAGSSSSTAGATTSAEYADRGQTSGGRQGGVEADKTEDLDNSGSVACGSTSKVLLTAALSDASLTQGFAQVKAVAACPGRVSWRQLQ